MEECHSLGSCRSVLEYISSGDTKVTKIGLRALCRLSLTELDIGNSFQDIGYNSYKDEGAVVLARHLHTLTSLSAWKNELGCEGVMTVSDSLIRLKSIQIASNREAMHGAFALGRLPKLKELSAGTENLIQGISD